MVNLDILTMRGEISDNNCSLLQVSYKAIISMIDRVFPFARSFENVFCNSAYVPWFSTRVQTMSEKVSEFSHQNSDFSAVFFQNVGQNMKL